MGTTIWIGDSRVKERLKKDLDAEIRAGRSVGGLTIKSSDQERIEYLLNFHKNAESNLRKAFDELSMERTTIGNLNSELARLKDEIQRLLRDREEKRVLIRKLEDERDAGKFDHLGGI